MGHRHHVRTEDLSWEEGSRGEFFAVRRRRVSRAAGGSALGCSLYEIAPGKTAFPFHFHHANEEAMYVLSGSATVRIGAERVAVRAGDYVAFPTGVDAAHQLTNTGSEPVRYLVMSTMVAPDVVGYPDSEKVGVFTVRAPGGDGDGGEHAFYKEGSSVGYYEGEPGGVEDGGKAQGGAGTASGTGTGTEPEDDDDDDEDLEKRIDDEIASLKAKLGLGKGVKKETKPKRGTTARTRLDSTLDELSRLKSLLDDD